MRGPARTVAMHWSVCAGNRCPGRLAGYEDVNDVERIRHDPAIRRRQGGARLRGYAKPDGPLRDAVACGRCESFRIDSYHLSGRWIDPSMLVGLRAVSCSTWIERQSDPWRAREEWLRTLAGIVSIDDSLHGNSLLTLFVFRACHASTVQARLGHTSLQSHVPTLRSGSSTALVSMRP